MLCLGRSRQGFCFGNKTVKYKQKQTVHTHSYSWVSTNTVLALSKGLHNLKKKMKMLSFRNRWISGMRIEDAQLYTFSVSYHKLRGYKSCYQESQKSLQTGGNQNETTRWKFKLRRSGLSMGDIIMTQHVNFDFITKAKTDQLNTLTLCKKYQNISIHCLRAWITP